MVECHLHVTAFHVQNFVTEIFMMNEVSQRLVLLLLDSRATETVETEIPAPPTEEVGEDTSDKTSQTEEEPLQIGKHIIYII